jgi:hypothetical protein
MKNLGGGVASLKTGESEMAMKKIGAGENWRKQNNGNQLGVAAANVSNIISDINESGIWRRRRKI